MLKLLKAKTDKGSDCLVNAESFVTIYGAQNPGSPITAYIDKEATQGYTIDRKEFLDFLEKENWSGKLNLPD